MTIRSISTKSPTVIAVTSGKGGVGKTLTSVNLAVAARRAGASVLILDGDLGLANVDVVLGLTARYSLRDVLDGHCALSDIILEGPLGIGVVPSGSGIASLTALTALQRQQMLDHIATLRADYDVIIIDTGAGISDTVMHFNRVADQVVVVTTPEPHSLTDAYAMIKVLAEGKATREPGLLVNMARSSEEGLKVFERLADVSGRFLNLRVNYLGHVPMDPAVPKAVMQRRAASEQSAFTVSGQAWTQIARKLLREASLKSKSGNVQDLWRHLLRDESPASHPHVRASF